MYHNINLSGLFKNTAQQVYSKAIQTIFNYVDAPIFKKFHTETVKGEIQGMQKFSAHICCGQMAAWVEMSLGMELGLGTGNFMLDGDPAPPPQKGAGAASPNFRHIFIVAKRLDG